MDTMNKTLVLQMADILNLHKELGDRLAWKNWFECFDINQSSAQFLSHVASIEFSERQIQSLKNQLSQSLDDESYHTLIKECHFQMESFQETMERKIELEHRPLGAYFNKDALVILTQTTIPEDIEIALSFGYKFQFPHYCSDKNMQEILAQIQMTIDEALPENRKLEASIGIHQILKSRDPIQHDDNIRWMKFISNRTASFLMNHPDIFATKSDKGGHTVVIDAADYDVKLASLLSDNNYTELDHNPLQGLIETETHFIETLAQNDKTKDLFEHLPLFEPNTLCLPKFYGLPKIHKKDTPLRPITSTIGSPGYLLAKIFDKMLKQIFPRSDYHIKDSFEFAEYIQNVTIKETDILVSFDVVSMFSSIPFELVKDIILNQSDDFLNCFSIERSFLEEMLEFLLRDCMVFSALDKTYKQVDGLPMGSCISPTIARLAMDRVINSLMVKIPSITFIKVFVDDTVAAINKQLVDEALQTLNNFRLGKIKFTIEHENTESKTINFLNVTLRRSQNKIVTNWFRKSFASGRLLNFYSSHKRTTVMQTAIHFIETVLLLSDPRYFNDNKRIVIKTLRDNSFPETTIMTLMNSIYTYMRPLKNAWTLNSESAKLIPYPPLVPQTPVGQSQDNEPLSQKTIGNNGDEKSGYVIFPHAICKGRKIKKVLCDFKWPKVILADSVRNTKVNSISSRKTITPIAERKNLILISNCKCKKKYRVVKTKF